MLRPKLCRQAAQIFILVFFAVMAASAQQDAAKATAVIHAGRLIDVRTGRVTTNAFITLAKDRILAITESATAGIPTIDLSKYTVVPGLIDCHAHVLGNQKDQSSASGLRMSSAQKALWGVHNLQIWLDHGFTALRDAGEADLGYGQLALRDSIEKGLIRGPRMVSAGNFVSVNGGHGDADVLAPDQSLPMRPNIADTVEGVSVAVRRDIKYGADWIKLMATGGVMDPISDYRVEELSQEQMAKAVEVAHRAGKKVMAHAEGAEGIKAAVRAGVDSIEHGTVMDEEGARLMEQRGTWLVPTLYCFQHDLQTGLSQGRDPVSFAKGVAIVKEQGPAFHRALAHHLKIAYGIDDDPDFVSKEFGALVSGGMTPIDALRAATMNGAELLGRSSEIGTLEPGKFADVVAVDGDPLADITVMEKVVFVMKGGEVYKNTSK
ncbi:MAG TPA: amidohydrolase family protein [Terriglobales bacterium]|nr:amidohydrolase family protein [Terriglobales bacterium]